MYWPEFSWDVYPPDPLHYSSSPLEILPSLISFFPGLKRSIWWQLSRFIWMVSLCACRQGCAREFPFSSDTKSFRFHTKAETFNTGDVQCQDKTETLVNFPKTRPCHVSNPRCLRLREQLCWDSHWGMRMARFPEPRVESLNWGDFYFWKVFSGVRRTYTFLQ